MIGSKQEDHDEISRAVYEVVEEANTLLAETYNNLESATETPGPSVILNPVRAADELQSTAPLASPPADTNGTVDHPQEDYRGEWGEKIVRGRDPAHMAELIRECEIYLTDRQAQVLKLQLVLGMSGREIAQKLHLYPSTVSGHLTKGKKVLETHRVRLRDEARRARAEYLRDHPELLE